MMAGFMAGHPAKGSVIRRSFGSVGVWLSAMTRRLALACVRIVSGLKIRVSAVRFCPWPLRCNHNSRAEIGAFGRSVAARVRFAGWRGIWRDLLLRLRNWWDAHRLVSRGRVYRLAQRVANERTFATEPQAAHWCALQRLTHELSRGAR